MTNKERLESIKEDVEIGIKVWGISIDDINWLIKQVKLKIFSEEMLHPKLGVLNEFLQKRALHKGAGNVGDNVIDVAIELIEILEKENDRYRAYLELILLTGTYGRDINTNEVLRSDEAELANEALGGNHND